MEWLNNLVRSFREFFPAWRIVRSTHAGVRFRRGKHVVPVGPGIVVYWPVITEIKTLPVVRQTTELAPQVLSTADGVEVAVSAVIVYRISDVVNAITQTWDIYQTIDDVAQTALAYLINSTNLTDLLSNRDDWEQWLQEKTQERLSSFGIGVETCRIINLARTFTIRLIGDHHSFNPGLNINRKTGEDFG